MKTLERTRARLREIVQARELGGSEISVLAKPLTPEEAIGTPGRRDYPILLGKERVIEATVGGAKGHAFTDSPQEYIGSLEDLMASRLETSGSSRWLSSWVAVQSPRNSSIDRV